MKMIINFLYLYLDTQPELRQQPIVLSQAFPTPRAAVAYILDIAAARLRSSFGSNPAPSGSKITRRWSGTSRTQVGMPI